MATSLVRGWLLGSFAARCLFLVTVVVLAGACLGNAVVAQTVSAAFIGPAESVFDTKTQSCERDDIPDGRAEAFRDQNNLVHLFSTHWVARAMVGPNLNQVRHSCTVVFRSQKDPNPADFQNYSWLSGFFTMDGRNVAAVVHNEFHGPEVPGMCTMAAPRPGMDCWWDSITYAVSHDGGNSFGQPPPPANLVASLPYQFARGAEQGKVGYQAPTNIVQAGSFYFILINTWKYRAQEFGACLLRTTDPFNPQSWRAWDGSGFDVQFVDPYRMTVADPDRHVCQPVAPRELPTVEGIRYLPAAGVYVATELAPDRRFGTPGFYLNTSRDLLHWSAPTLLSTKEDLFAAEPPGRWDYLYLSLLDPGSTDRNFATVGNTPYLYYVRLDRLHPPFARTLMRRQIRLTPGT